MNDTLQPPSTPPHLQPIHVELDVRPTDEGFRYTIRVWTGDVDVRNTPPTRPPIDSKPYARKGACYRAAIAQMARLS